MVPSSDRGHYLTFSSSNIQRIKYIYSIFRNSSSSSNLLALSQSATQWLLRLKKVRQPGKIHSYVNLHISVITATVYIKHGRMFLEPKQKSVRDPPCPCDKSSSESYFEKHCFFTYSDFFYFCFLTASPNLTDFFTSLSADELKYCQSTGRGGEKYLIESFIVKEKKKRNWKKKCQVFKRECCFHVDAAWLIRVLKQHFI